MTDPLLLTPDAFRAAVLARDGGACAFCDQPATDVCHVLEGRLWPDGGRYLDNGVSLCPAHLAECWGTAIPVAAGRAACGIAAVLMPPQLERDQTYDRWGNPVLADGRRLRGELFHDPEVQAALERGGVLADFTTWVKYPRTYHLPWSPGIGDDDRVMASAEGFDSERVIVTEKMDGENTTLYRDHLHARSLEAAHHPSRDWVKRLWSGIAAEIPEGWRVCGENLYARHAIAYRRLPSYFLGFSVWNERNVALSWDDTLDWFALLGIEPVPLLYDGP